MKKYILQDQAARSSVVIKNKDITGIISNNKNKESYRKGKYRKKFWT